MGEINFGDLIRREPISRCWGCDRGSPVDRYYIEAFLRAHRRDIRGRVLEVKDRQYTSVFGSAVTQSDVLDVDTSNPHANLRTDLQTGAGIPDDVYDCIILTQVLQYIYDLHAALRTVYRILAPAGVLLMTVPGITATREGDGPWYWSFHKQSVSRLLLEHFNHQRVVVEAHGNVGLAVSFLQGLAVQEIPPELLRSPDEEYPIVFSARAAKAVPKHAISADEQ